MHWVRSLVPNVKIRHHRDVIGKSGVLGGMRLAALLMADRAARQAGMLDSVKGASTLRVGGFRNG